MFGPPGVVVAEPFKSFPKERGSQILSTQAQMKGATNDMAQFALSERYRQSPAGKTL